MAVVLPFQGYRYNPEQVANLAAVVSPPYDVISEESRRRLHLQHPLNVVRLILGEDRAGDDGGENRYVRARRYFEEWEGRGVLVPEDRPTFYLYRQDYTWRWGEKRVRTGLIGAVRLEEYQDRVILPHEGTLPGPKADRLQLLRALPVHLEQIFCFYPGPAQPIRGLLERALHGPSLCDFWNGEGIRHRLWALQEPTTVAALHTAFQERQLIIADGHHRYETALTFREEMRQVDASPSPLKAYNYLMVNLVSIEDEGLTVLPTHRLVTPPRHRRGAEILQAVEPYFRLERRLIPPAGPDIQQCLQEMEDRRGEGHIFGLYVGGVEFYLLTLKDRSSGGEILGPGSSPALRELDLVVLHRLVFQRLLGLSDEAAIGFTPDETSVLEQVRTGRYAAAFFVNPTPVSQVVKAVMAGERLPPKTTYFYPKLLSGLIFFKVDPTQSLSDHQRWV